MHFFFKPSEKRKTPRETEQSEKNEEDSQDSRKVQQIVKNLSI